MSLVTIEAIIDQDGRLLINDEIDLKGKRVLITISSNNRGWGRHVG